MTEQEFRRILKAILVEFHGWSTADLRRESEIDDLRRQLARGSDSALQKTLDEKEAQRLAALRRFLETEDGDQGLFGGSSSSSGGGLFSGARLSDKPSGKT